MMPFSVFRMWGLGLLSWAILGGGAYLLWEYADRVQARNAFDERLLDESTAQGSESSTNRSNDTVGSETLEAPGALNQQRAIRTRGTHRDWPYLAGGVALVLLSFGGFLPVLPFLGKPQLSEPQVMRTGEAHTVNRPDGAQLHVEVYGQKNGTTLVLTHGWSLDSTAWYYAKRELAGKYRLVTWDLRGLGKSKGPNNGDYSLETMAGDLEAVLAAVARKGPVFLVGHSIGGMISQTFCRKFPEHLGHRVQGVVLLHTTYTNPLRTALGAPFLSAIERPLIVPLNHLTIWLAPLVWLSNWQSYLNGTLHIFTRIASFAGEQTWGQVNYGARLAASSWPGVVARGNLEMLKFDEQATLPKINVPVLVVAASNDRMTKPSASEHIESLLPQGIPTALQPAGHLGFWEQHADFAEVLSEFVGKYSHTPAAKSASAEAGV